MPPSQLIRATIISLLLCATPAPAMSQTVCLGLNCPPEDDFSWSTDDMLDRFFNEDVINLRTNNGQGFGYGTADYLHCEKDCDFWYNSAVAYCRIHPDPASRASCYSAAINAYGNCERKCRSDF